jgi:hypothetical protein
LAVQNVARRSVASELAALLDSPEIAGLVAELETLRWTGRKGYPTRALVGACLAKSLYALPTWTRTAALIAEHAALREACGAAPSVYALYRFGAKLRTHKPLLDACLDRLAASLRAELPGYGLDVAIDASDMPAYANGQRYLSKGGPERKRFSDPDAAWGHRSAVSTRKGGGFYGYKIQAAVCARTELPLAWRVESANHHESLFALPLLDALHERGFTPETCAMDKAYDSRATHDAFEAQGCHPVIAHIQARNAATSDDVPTCAHGRWAFTGADFKRKLTKWRCPSGECTPKSIWLKADRRNPLIPHETKRWRDLYGGRGSVERAFGRLKHERGLAPLRVRGLDKVGQHADLCILATLASALARAPAVPLAA